MDQDTLYELVTEAVRSTLDDAQGGHLRVHRRMVGGRILFEDDQGREVKAIPVESLFKKVTAVRERLRVLEQKINNHSSLSVAEKAELQDYITRSYGSLTTFNFLFRDDADRFTGTGS